MRPALLGPLDATRARSDPGAPASLTHRVVVLLGVVGLFGPALAAWPSIVQIPLAGVVAVATCAVAVALAVVAVASAYERVLERIDVLVLVLALVILGAWTASELFFRPSYGTDEAAFIQYAAQIFLHGRDPYSANLLPALTQFRVPIKFATYRLNGTIASHLAYPALSFLLVAPITLLTHGVQSVILVNMLALAAEMVLLYRFLPRDYRLMSVILAVGMPYLFDNTIGGVVATALAVPFLLVVAHRWASIGRGGCLGSSDVQRAVCLGLAVSVGQFAWFIVPFLVVAIWRLRASELGRRRASLVVARFVGAAATVALVVNVPFIVWSPHAWFAGVLSPLFQKAIPLGQGLIDATIFLHVGGGDLDYFTAAAVALLVALLVAHSLYFSRLARATFILPSLVFLLSTRALSEYFIMAVGVWVMAAADGQTIAEGVEAGERLGARSVRANMGLRGRRGAGVLRGCVLGASFLAVLVFAGLALTARPPLVIKVQSMQTNGQFQSIWRIRARVTNRSGQVLRPHFATDSSGYMTGFWHVLEGPRRLRPGEPATYLLAAPNVGSMPGVTQSFLLQAVSASPDTMSSSQLLTPEPFTCTISPNYVDQVVPLGHSVEFSVRLRSPYGAPVHRRGVRVALGQVIYAQDGLIPSEATINGAPEGRSPVVAVTNASGVARFTVSSHVVQEGNPLYFQAYVDPSGSFPYGYSEVVDVLWSRR